MKQNIIKIAEYTRNLNLLYVEDDLHVVEDTKELLKKFFKNVIHAKDGIDGINKFNENRIDLIITDINMPNMNGLDMLQEIRKLNSSIPSIVISAHNESEYLQKAINLNTLGYIVKPMIVEDLFTLFAKLIENRNEVDIKSKRISLLVDANKKLIDIGYQISIQKDNAKLLETILKGAQELSNADAGTLYIYDNTTHSLNFEIVLNKSLDIHFGGSKGQINWPNINLYNLNETVNNKNVAAVCATNDMLINIDNIYQSQTYDFSGAKEFDNRNNYKTTSMLVIPMKNRENELIGVIQLINKLDEEGQILSFDDNDEILITSMASQATMMLENNKLVDDIENLLAALIKSIGSALSAKSSYTAKHIDNVAKLAEIITNGINENQTIYKDITFNDDEIEEIKLSAILHDIGKIATPLHIVDKKSKLSTIVDRIENIKYKFELVKKDIEISYLKNHISHDTKQEKIKQLNEDLKFIEMINHGDTYMTDEYIDKLNEITTKYMFDNNGNMEKVINDNELHNLSTRRGTLTQEDRNIINDHVIVTYDMLKDVPFPKNLSNVPSIAGSHHKTPDGQGYAAEELLGIELTIADNILALADIFEALSASDRPYRKANTLNQIANILVNMAKQNQIDKDIVKLFFSEQLYVEYSKNHLADFQIDEITVNFDF